MYVFVLFIRHARISLKLQNQLEDVQHVWLCQGMDSPKKWESTLTALEVEMRRLQTDPILVQIIISRLRTWQLSEEPADHDIPERYKEVLQSQDSQGWSNFWMGLPSKGWQEIPHYHRIASSKTGPSWLIAIIRKQWLIAWDIWDYRNSIVHDKDNGTDIQQVANAIRAEYAAGTPSREMRKFFRLPLRDTLRRNFDYQTNWLHRVATHRERTHRKDPSLRRSQACLAAFVGLR
jgi:hypothetical protein